MSIQQRRPNGNASNDRLHGEGDATDTRRRLTVAEARAESLERECATLQQSISELQGQLERSRQNEQTCRRLIEDKNKWLARLAHDLRSPLGGVRGMADLMLQGAVSGVQRSQLEVVKSTADEMLDLVTDLVEVGRDGAGLHDRDEAEFDVAQLLADTVKNSALVAEKKGLNLYYDYAADLPQFVLGDPVRLRRVVANLVNNAIKFTERGEVKVSALRVNDSSSADQLQIVVEDTGAGIRTEKQHRIFDAFWRDDSAAGADGVGLGLSICSELVVQMGGRIWVESAPGCGSRFYVSLPWTSPTDQPSGDQPLLGDRLILVSDASRRRSTYREVLQRAGADVLACRAATFQRILASGDIHTLACDGVIIDCVNDAELELALAQEFRQVMGSSRKRLVLLVPRSAAAIWARCDGLPNVTSVAKPVDYGELIQALTDNKPIPPARDGKSTTEPLRILLADDCEVNQMVAAGLLGMCGHRVDTVGNGQLAVDAMGDDAYDLVLIDLEMPVLDGVRATRMMRENGSKTKTRLPIVGMTADAENSKEDRWKKYGMDACLSKPLDPHVLLSTIAELTQRQSSEPSTGLSWQETDGDRRDAPMSSRTADPAHRRPTPNVAGSSQRAPRTLSLGRPREIS